MQHFQGIPERAYTDVQSFVGERSQHPLCPSFMLLNMHKQQLRADRATVPTWTRVLRGRRQWEGHVRRRLVAPPG